MWNKLNSFRRICRVSIWRTLFFNFYMLPFNQAIKIPIILTRNVRFYSLSGNVILNGNVKPAMVRFGFFGEDNMHWSSQKTLLKIDGEITLTENIHFANAIIIRVEKDAILKIESNVKISNGVKIVCYNDILIKKNTRIAWESQLIDTTFHFIKDINTDQVNTLNGKIQIGSNNWIGNRTSIMKGAILPDFCIVASGSMVNKNFSEQTYSILAGSPAKLIKEGVYRVLDIEEKEIKQKLANLK